MIDVLQQKILNERRQWSGCVQRFLQRAEIESHETAAAVTESLAVFCQGRAQIQGHELSLLTARAFCAAGDEYSAGRILHRDRAYRPHTTSWLEILSARYPFPELFPLFSARALRPIRLTTAGVFWMLDFSKLNFAGAEQHELILFQTLRRLIEKISGVWNESAGAGRLGIKHLSTLTAVAGEQQLIEYIGTVLEHCARRNGWKNSPQLLLIDL